MLKDILQASKDRKALLVSRKLPLFYAVKPKCIYVVGQVQLSDEQDEGERCVF